MQIPRVTHLFLGVLLSSVAFPPTAIAQEAKGTFRLRLPTARGQQSATDHPAVPSVLGSSRFNGVQSIGDFTPIEVVGDDHLIIMNGLPGSPCFNGPPNPPPVIFGMQSTLTTTESAFSQDRVRDSFSERGPSGGRDIFVTENQFLGGYRLGLASGHWTGGQLRAEIQARLGIDVVNAVVGITSTNHMQVYVRGGPGTAYYLERHIEGYVHTSGNASASFNGLGGNQGIDDSYVLTQGVTQGGTQVIFAEYPGVTYSRVFAQDAIADAHFFRVCSIGCGPVMQVRGAAYALIDIRANIAGEPPVALIDGPSEIIVGDAAVFQSESYDPDNGTNPGDGIRCYEWRLDGQVVSNGPSAAVQIDEAGPHTISLTVYDAEGETDTSELPILATRLLRFVSVDDTDPNNPVLTFEAQGVFDGIVARFYGNVVYNLVGSPHGQASFVISNLADYPRQNGRVILEAGYPGGTAVAEAVVDMSLDSQSFRSGWPFFITPISAPYALNTYCYLQVYKCEWLDPKGAKYNRLLDGLGSRNPAVTLTARSNVPHAPPFVVSSVSATLTVRNGLPSVAQGFVVDDDPDILESMPGFFSALEQQRRVWGKSGETAFELSIMGQTNDVESGGLRPWAIGPLVRGSAVYVLR